MDASQWSLLARLVLALVLASLIGVERELRQKSAGVRTYALVGVGAALFTIVGAYGFGSVTRHQQVVADPSRVASLVVSGIGFIGGGLIFVHGDSVRGLTTAAGIWATAAVGMACGAGLAILAGAGAVIYLVVSVGYAWVEQHAPWLSFSERRLEVTYRDGAGVLRQVISACNEHGFEVTHLAVEHRDADGTEIPTVTIALTLRGHHPLPELVGALDVIDGVRAVLGDQPTAGPVEPRSTKLARSGGRSG